MRVYLEGDATAGEFLSMLLSIGNGELTADGSGLVTIPPGCGELVNVVEALSGKVFPNLAVNYKNHRWLCERAILAPRNDIASKINEKLLMQLPGKEQLLKSIDTVVDMSDSVQYPTEFLNSLDLPGMPPHNLILKGGARLCFSEIWMLPIFAMEHDSSLNRFCRTFLKPPY